MKVNSKVFIVWIEFGGNVPNSALKRLGPRTYHQGTVWFQRKLTNENDGFFLHLDLDGWQNIPFRLHATFADEDNQKGIYKVSRDFHRLMGNNVILDGLKIDGSYNQVPQGYVQVELKSGWFTFTLHSDKQ